MCLHIRVCIGLNLSGYLFVDIFIISFISSVFNLLSLLLVSAIIQPSTTLTHRSDYPSAFRFRAIVQRDNSSRSIIGFTCVCIISKQTEPSENFSHSSLPIRLGRVLSSANFLNELQPRNSLAPFETKAVW